MTSVKILGWIVFAIGLGAYVPLIIGGWSHPLETNLACFMIWVALAITLCYSQIVQKYDGWRIQVAYAIGNIIVVVIALARGGYTINIGLQEAIALYGFVITVCTWAAVGAKTKRWNPEILYLGTVTVDMVSFYPQLKQYLQPHEPASTWCLVAWSMFGLAMLINFSLVEQLFRRLFLSKDYYKSVFGEDKSYVKIFKASYFSIENFLFILTTVVLMAR